MKVTVCSSFAIGVRFQPQLSVCGTASVFKAKHNKTKIPMTTKFIGALSFFS